MTDPDEQHGRVEVVEATEWRLVAETPTEGCDGDDARRGRSVGEVRDTGMVAAQCAGVAMSASATAPIDRKRA